LHKALGSISNTAKMERKKQRQRNKERKKDQAPVVNTYNPN
jgi:hypothetical protein